MKKFFTTALMTFLAVFTVSCISSHREMSDTLAYRVDGINVEEKINMDNAYMSTSHNEYRWLECRIDAEDFIDSSDVFTVESVTNIYSVIDDGEDSTRWSVFIYKFLHTYDFDTMIVEEGIVLGYSSMNKFVPMKVDFAHAYDAMMRANCVKPHSKHCSLCKEPGETGVDPIYIFGDQGVYAYVNSTDGSVTATNPVFNKN